MVTTPKQEHADAVAPDQLQEVEPALLKLGGWDPVRRRWVHGDPGKQALALVNEAAAKKRAAKAPPANEPA